MATLHVHSEALMKIHDTIHRHFWPSNLFGDRINSALKKSGHKAAAVMVFVYSTAVIYFTGLFVVSLSSADFVLPLKVHYGFDAGHSPLFEILYFVQCWTNIFVVMHAIRGHDDLFVAFTVNCTGQFKLLSEAVASIGTGREKEINILLDRVDHEPIRCQSEETKLLVRCVRHHERLLGLCDEMERAFSGSVFVQLFVSVAAICVSSFALVVVELEITEMPGLFCYCFGHITQLFIFCTMGEEIAHAVRTV